MMVMMKTRMMADTAPVSVVVRVAGGRRYYSRNTRTASLLFHSSFFFKILPLGVIVQTGIWSAL